MYVPSSGVESNSPDLPIVDQHTGRFIGGPTVVGGGEDREKTAVLLELGREGERFRLHFRVVCVCVHV